MNCETCEAVGIVTPAATTRNGQDVCGDCAHDIDSREQTLQDLRDAAYDARGIRK